MALIHRAEIRPTKLELLNPWVAARSWYAGPPDPGLRRVGAFRFDDPDGEVGVETFLVRAGDGPVLQLPMTFRGAPLAGADRHLIGTMEHSVLGPRWVYDGCGDPVYAAALLATMLTGGAQAPEFVDVDGVPTQRAPLATVHGSGSPAAVPPAVTAVTRVDPGDPTVITTDAGELAVVRVIGSSPDSTAAVTLTGVWEGQGKARLLARVL